MNLSIMFDLDYPGILRGQNRSFSERKLRFPSFRVLLLDKVVLQISPCNSSRTEIPSVELEKPGKQKIETLSKMICGLIRKLSLSVEDVPKSRPMRLRINDTKTAF